MQEQPLTDWRHNLQGGEQIIWVGTTFDDLGTEERASRRLAGLVVLAPTVAVALLLAWNFAHTPFAKPGWYIPDLQGFYLWPLYTLGIVACAVVAAFAMGPVFSKTPLLMTYVVTSTRLLVCDSGGRVVREIGRNQIAAVGVPDRSTSPRLTIWKKGGLMGDTPFVIRHVADLAGLARGLKQETSGD